MVGTKSQAQEIEPLFEINLPEQDATIALEEFAEQTGAITLFPYDLVAGKVTNAVIGRFTLPDALERLLAGTGLSGGLSEKRMISIADVSAATSTSEENSMEGQRVGFIGTMLAALGFSAGSGVEAVAQTAAEAILEEVVVTARRREESLEDLPLSVVAISGEAMRVQGIYSTEQLSEFAPNVTMINGASSHRPQVIIRGVGGGAGNPLPVIGTGTYIDGHYLPGGWATFMSTVDVERVEVLRGPQGTLFGKNVTGGAINVVTTKPGPEFASSLTARVGDFGQQDIRGMLNVPISDNLFFRGTFASEQQDGYYENIFLNDNVDYTDIQTYRGALRWQPNDNWTIDATVTTATNRDGQMGRQCRVRPRQGTLDDLAALGEDVSAWTAVPNDPATSFNDAPGQWGGGMTGGHINRLGPVSTNGQVVTNGGSESVIRFWEYCDQQVAAGPFANGSEKRNYADSDKEAILFSANWDSGGAIGGLDNLEIRTNLSWRNFSGVISTDSDSSPLPITAVRAGSNQQTRNFEMIFDMDVNDRLTMLFGVYRFEEESRHGDGDCWPRWLEIYDFETNTLNGSAPCGPAGGGGRFDGRVTERLPDRPLPGGPTDIFANIDVYTDSTAVFGHATYAINDDWDLDIGARWTEDQRSFNILEFDTAGTCTFIGDRVCEPTPILNQANVLEEGFFNLASATFDEITPMISLSRNLAGGDTLDSGMVYFLYSEGFMTGSFNDELNLNLTPELAPLVVYGPEYVDNFEVGFKGTFADGRVRLNADVFWMDYQDKQEEVLIDNSDGRFGPDFEIEFVSNAAQVDIYGIELELQASPWDGGFITLATSYLFNEYSDYLVDDIDNPGQQLDLSTSHIGDLTPDWTLNASVGHTFVFGSGATLTPTLGVYSQGEYEWLANNAQLSDPGSVCNQGAYSKFRARVTYTPPAGNWDASLFGSNITDERYYENCAYGRTGTYVYRYGRPDAWGLEFTGRWGGS